jgi:prevent-host-death family protein
MEVGVRELRNNLARWLARVKEGDEVVVTERGRPIARLVPVRDRTLDELIEAGIVTPAKRPKTKLAGLPKIRPKGSVTEILLEMRRESPY